MSRARRSSRRRRRVRRLLVLGLLGGLAETARRRRGEPAVAPAEPPRWPPLRPATATTDPADDAAVASAHRSVAGLTGDGAEPVTRPAGATSDAPWVDPINGECPITHPVKGNASSRIYHVPGSRHYTRTIPERCYRDGAAAEADGMRAPKR